jgi:magnesium-transporting ATPase (P-type)
VSQYHHNDPQNDGELSPPAPILDTSRLRHHASRSALGGAAAVHPPAVIKAVTAEGAAAAPEGKTAGGEEGGEGEMPEATRKAFTEAMEVADVENGLSEGVVESQRTKHGFNESIEKQTPLWLLFLQKFKGPVPYMIIIAMAVAYGLQKWSAQTHALSCATPSRYANRSLK